jgi:NAD(P)-dependent dehydrogenase (short-subunit alcohol dehydrogenase family)
MSQGLFVVTGGSRGIGAATARLAAQRGWPVVITYRQQDGEAQSVVSAIEAAGGRAHAVRFDVSDESAVVAGFAQIDRLGPIAVLVNNAGVTGGRARVEDVTVQMIDQACRVNIVGSFLCAREAVRRMSSRRGGTGGVIINVSSGAAVHGASGTWVHYAATKGAMDTMTAGLAKEVAAEGIRVNAVRPGVIHTDIHDGRSDEEMARLKATIPMGRYGTPNEVAEAIVWLASPASSYTTGALLDVRGGY